jgi:hypothetical protein
LETCLYPNFLKFTIVFEISGNHEEMEIKLKENLSFMARPFGRARISESANFVSLRFCVLDNNIRNFMCVK